MIRYDLLVCLFMFIAATVAAEDLSLSGWSISGEHAVNSETGVTYTNQGQNTIGSDGSVVTQLEQGLFRKGHVTYRRSGNSYYGSNGVIWHKWGHYWQSNSGKRCNEPLFSCREL